MDKISLEWFLQMPGLFITIGVLLILIALLILIISRAVSRKNNDSVVLEGEEGVPNSFDVPVSHPNETVNVLNEFKEQNNINQTTNDNINKVSNVENQLPINNPVNNTVTNPTETALNEPKNDNIMPIADNDVSIVTPVNIVNNENQIDEEPVQENIVNNPYIAQPIMPQTNVTNQSMEYQSQPIEEVSDTVIPEINTTNVPLSGNYIEGTVSIPLVNEKNLHQSLENKDSEIEEII